MLEYSFPRFENYESALRELFKTDPYTQFYRTNPYSEVEVFYFN